MAPPRLLYITDNETLGLTDAAAAPRPLAAARCDLAASWPVWRPGGDAALVSVSGRDAEGGARLELLQIAADGAAPPIALFRNAPGAADVIAPGVPHYASWAPDGRLAALVARGGESLRLYLVAAGGRVPARALHSGAPLFTAWSPTGPALAVHAGEDLLLFDIAGEEPKRILHDQPRFRTPAWDRQGAGLFYVALGAAGSDLLWRSQPDGGRDVVSEIEGPTALLASPRSDRLALLTLSGGGLGGHNLRLLDPRTGATQTVERGPVHAALWAPDGSRLFTFVPTGVEPDYALHRCDLGSGRQVQLARFRPSPAYTTYLAFFDQYAHSHSLLSAGGEWLLLGGTMTGNGAGARRPPGPQWGCYAVPTDGNAPPRWLAAGEIGFFEIPTP